MCSHQDGSVARTDFGIIKITNCKLYNMIDVIELLNGIREKAFEDVDLTSLPKMSAEEKRTLVWENMERLLALGDDCKTAEWLADQYLDVSTGNPNYDNPMLNTKGTDFLDSSVAHLSEEERCFARFAYDMGILAYHLLAREQLWEDYYFGEGYDNDAYELDEDMQDRYPGLMKILKESFAIDNKPCLIRPSRIIISIRCPLIEVLMR